MNISGSIRYFIGLAFRSLWQEKKIHFQSIFSLYLVLMCILALLFFSQNLKQSISNMASQVQISVYFKADVAMDKIKGIQASVCKDPYIERCNLIASSDAKEKFLKDNPNLKATIKQLKNNPFPNSIEVIMLKDFSDASWLSEKVLSLSKLESVDEAISDQVLAKKWFSILKLLRLALSVILMFSLFVLLGITSHVVGLLTFMKQKQIEIMSLIGATDAMIAISFITCAIMNSLIALGLALLSYVGIVSWLKSYLQNMMHMPWLSLNYFSGSSILLMVMFSLCVGVLGGYLGVKRFLK